LKGEERVCHVTEADRLGAANAVRLSEKCLHVRPLCAGATWLRRVTGAAELRRELGVLPLCAAVLSGGSHGLTFAVPPGIKRK
jgi:hypothetical protein